MTIIEFYITLRLINLLINVHLKKESVMQKEYYQESQSDYRAIINSSEQVFSKEITINSISGLFEISSVFSDDSYISGRRLMRI